MKLLIEKALGGIQSYYKTKGIKNIISHEHRRKNLIEMLAFYPHNGQNFKALRNDWPEHKYYVVEALNLTSTNTGEVVGILFENGVKFSDKPEVIQKVLSRQLWSHIVQPSRTILDNGMEYDERDFQRFKDFKFKKDKSV